MGFPRLYAAASLKPSDHRTPRKPHSARFPRLYAAASLKQRLPLEDLSHEQEFSAALCRGLIEARGMYKGIVAG